MYLNSLGIVVYEMKRFSTMGRLFEKGESFPMIIKPDDHDDVQFGQLMFCSSPAPWFCGHW